MRVLFSTALALALTTPGIAQETCPAGKPEIIDLESGWGKPEEGFGPRTTAEMRIDVVLQEVVATCEVDESGAIGPCTYTITDTGSYRGRISQKVLNSYMDYFLSNYRSKSTDQPCQTFVLDFRDEDPSIPTPDEAAAEGEVPD